MSHSSAAAARATRAPCAGIQPQTNTPNGAVDARASFFLGLVFLNKRDARRKNGRKRQKQTAENGSVTLREPSRGHGDQAAERKSRCVFAPTYLRQLFAH